MAAALINVIHRFCCLKCAVFIVRNFKPIGGMLRPSLTSPVRPYFNWIHWFIGTGSWTIASILLRLILLSLNVYICIICTVGVNIFLSTELSKNGLRKNFKYIPNYVMAGYIISFILAAILLEIISSYRFYLYGKLSKE